MLTLTTRLSPPGWALWQRFLLETMAEAAHEFVRRYTRPDGTLVWRETWPGMDGSDDAYESFFNFPLLVALGGDWKLDALARAEWEALTRQFTAYGQIYREFDAYYDWMHHGESSLLFYYFALTAPDDLRMRARALRFAAMYTGDDPEAPNYDPQKRIIRSPITGSRGPRFVNSAEDWVTHRPVLAHYPPPFDDVPGLPPDAQLADWNDETLFAAILELLNRRMMQGDVPLNLTATSLITHAFLLTGDAKYRNWVLDYTQAWRERAEANGGLLPDNVGPNGLIGELMDGKWYGGYYGWRWPHGFMTLIEPTLIAASNALLLTGDASWLDFPRQLLDRIYAEGREIDGVYCIPHRHGDRGWYDFRPAHASVAEYPLRLWFLSQSAQDAERVAQWRGDADWSRLPEGRGKGDNIHGIHWFHALQTGSPDYPEAILKVNYAEVCRRFARIQTDTTDPETWDVHHWQDLNPVVCEGLVQTMLGGPNAVYHGGLLHTSVRYFDLDRKRPGLPSDVAALVSQVDAAGIALALTNLNPMEERRVVIQAGMFGEHTFVDGALLDTESANWKFSIGGPRLEVCLTPASAGTLRLNLRRHSNTPEYAFPWRCAG